jgi:hypothetical protein
VTLPGADELFRTTGTASRPDPKAAEATAPSVPGGAAAGGAPVTAIRPRRTATRSSGTRRPSGRERHDEKITVYVSPEELVDLEHARLTLRAEHGLAVDRGRIVREALAVVIADLEAKGADSILVRRLRDH